MDRGSEETSLLQTVSPISQHTVYSKVNDYQTEKETLMRHAITIVHRGPDLGRLGADCIPTTCGSLTAL